MPASIAIPNIVRARAQNLGEAGNRWLAELPQTVATIELAWSVTAGAVITGGSESLVLEAIRADGSNAIIKIGLPGSADLSMEARVYRLAGESGFARLYEHEEVHNAVLLERLGEPLGSRGLSMDAQIVHLCKSLNEVWIPLDAAHGLMTGAEKARWLINFIQEKWEALGRPGQERVIKQALHFAEERERAHCAKDAVLVHGDAHPFNALASLGSSENADPSYKFVDPDGLFAERACDLAVPMRDWCLELLAGDTRKEARQRCELLSQLTGVEPEPIWQWGFVERVSTALVLIEIGEVREGAAYLEVAARVCD
ncbi:MAG: aminoglycoside phosphotransferase family protein [Pseudomonadales bacterium]